jgi:hypothetical protein
VAEFHVLGAMDNAPAPPRSFSIIRDSCAGCHQSSGPVYRHYSIMKDMQHPHGIGAQTASSVPILGCVQIVRHSEEGHFYASSGHCSREVVLYRPIRRDAGAKRQNGVIFFRSD